MSMWMSPKALWKVDGFEGFRADEDGVGVGKAVGFALRVEEFVDG